MVTVEQVHQRHGHRLPIYMWEEQNLTFPYILTNESTSELPEPTDCPNCTTANTPTTYLDPFVQTLYIYVTSFMIIFCSISIIVNIFILSSMCFVRGRISPTLHISLSLAGADTCSLFLFALGLLLFSLLPMGLGISLVGDCMALIIESFRMGGMLTTMLHLLALAGNHYLGILSPLHYPSYMTRRNIQYCAIFLWTVPSSSLIVYLFLVEGDGFGTCPPYTFLTKTRFRSRFSLSFFTTLIIMIFIYSHIYALVRKHQRNRDLYRAYSSCSTRSQANEKAILTTLLIVGSTVIGWMPAVIYYTLVCEDCLLKQYWRMRNIPEFLTLTVLNLLIICKTASNSYIYAFRMKEIRLALRCMKCYMLRLCRGLPQDSANTCCVNSEQGFSHSSMPLGRCRTVVCRMRSHPEQHGNGSYTAVSIRNGSAKSTYIQRSASSKSFQRRQQELNTSV